MTQNEAFRKVSIEFKNLFELGVNGVDESAFAECWEAAGAMRPAMITLLGRRAAASVASGRSRDSVMTSVCDFAFKFMGYRYIGMLFDIVSLALSGAASQESGVDMVRIGKDSPFSTPQKLEAAVFGASGMIYHDPQRLSGF